MSDRMCSHHLSPRLAETLRELLSGASAKQIAAELGLSQHTVHNYIKTIYREYSVNSRGELLALFIVPEHLAMSAIHKEEMQ